MEKIPCIVIIVGTDQNRDGLNEDITSIKETFEELFDAEVIEMINYTTKEIQNEYKKFKTEPWLTKFADVRFVTVFCLAHGSHNGQVLLGNNNEVVDGQRLLLNPLFKFEQLDGKLKWLVVQACRGNLNRYKSMQRDGRHNIFPEFHVISYCTGEGTLSFQTDRKGKIYIQELCKELRQNVRTRSLCQMLENVATRVKDFAKTQNCETFQLPEYKKNIDDYFFYKVE